MIKKADFSPPHPFQLKITIFRLREIQGNFYLACHACQHHNKTIHAMINVLQESDKFMLLAHFFFQSNLG